MNKFLKYSLYIALVAMFSCNQQRKKFSQEEVKMKSLPSFNLAGKFYFLAPELDSSNCDAKGACDCCADNVLFLNDSVFIRVAYCIGDDMYYKGIYRIDNNEIIFSSDSLRVDVIEPEIYGTPTPITDTADSIGTMRIEVTMEKILSFKWKGFLCNDKVFFIENGSDFVLYATPAREQKEKFIQQLKQDSIWDKLGLAN